MTQPPSFSLWNPSMALADEASPEPMDRWAFLLSVGSSARTLDDALVSTVLSATVLEPIAPLQPLETGPAAVDPGFAAAVSDPFGLDDVRASASPTFADIDADGDFDLFIGLLDGTTVFYRNTGSATAPAFTAEGNNFGLTDVGAYVNPTLADIDGDGDLDAFVGSNQGTTRFFSNVGTAAAPSFSGQGVYTAFPDVGNSASPTFADIDDDGDLDAFIGGSDGNITLVRNTGTAMAPVFQVAADNFGLTDVGNSASPAFADIDADGDLDAFVGERSGAVWFFRNTGSDSAPAFSAEAGNFGLTVEGDYTTVALVDIDADGDTDAFLGYRDGVVRFFANQPGVVITPSDGGTAVGESGDGDNYTVVLARAPAHDVTITLDTTNGQVEASVSTLVFTPANWNVPQTVTVTAVDDAVGEGSHTGGITHAASSEDAGYDGLDIDPVLVAITDDDLLPGDPDFAPGGVNAFGLTDAGAYASPTFADIDADGDLDAFIGNSEGDTLFFRNAGSASAPAFEAPTTNPFGLTNAGYSVSPTFADIDGDGDLDAFVGNSDGDTLFFRNDGSGAVPSFAAAQSNPFGLTSDLIVDPRFVDIDGDGDLDAFIGAAVGNLLFCLNAGTATAPVFESAITNPFGLANIGSSVAPVFADIDGDGDFDALAGNFDGDLVFFRNTGTATSPAFAAASIDPFGLMGVGRMAVPGLADIDADGDLDAFVGRNTGDTLFQLNNATFVVPNIAVVGFTDTAFDDVFTTVSRTISTRGAEISALSFGISGGTDNGTTVTVASAYGVLTITKATGAYSFVPDDAAIEALGTAVTASFSVTVTNGTLTRTKTLKINLAQSGTTETAGDDRLAGTSGADRFSALGGNDTVSGAGGSDALNGGSGNDSLLGGAGNDTMQGGTGNNRLEGGGGNDRYVLTGEEDGSSIFVDSGGVADVLQLQNNGFGTYGEYFRSGDSLVIKEYDELSTGALLSTTTLQGFSGSGYIEFLQLLDVPTGESYTWNLAIAAAGGSGNDMVMGTLDNDSLTGAQGADVLWGASGDDSLDGGAGKDDIKAGAGHDVLNGGTGADELLGQSGNDVYIVDDPADRVDERVEYGPNSNADAGGFDTVQASLDWTLGEFLEALVFSGNEALDGSGNGLANTITGNGGANALTGGSGDDTLLGGGDVDSLTGGSGNDSLDGGGGGDSLSGGGGNDRLNGAGGNDTLTGGDGLDTFRFSSALNGSTNVDRIKDFDPVDDRIELENSVFTKLTTTGALNAANFKASASGNAADGNDFVLYETDTGKLFYDADGNGSGAKVLVATLTGAPALTSADIFVT